MDDKDLEVVSCCLCGSQEHSTLKSVTAKGKSPKLVKCKCGLVFFSPRFKKEYLNRIYSRDNLKQINSNVGYLEEDKVDFAKRLDLAEKYAKIESALDIGCSTGTFLLCCRERGYKKYCGVDINIKTNEYCMSMGIAASTKMPAARFDLVNMSDVIEHLSYPDEFLRDVHKNVKDGGLLMLTTPNISNPLNHILNIKAEEHLYYFSKDTIRKLLEKNGFEILEMRIWNRYHALKNVVDTTTADRIRPLLKLLLALRIDPLVNLILIKNLYTDVFVLARKIRKNGNK